MDDIGPDSLEIRVELEGTAVGGTSGMMMLQCMMRLFYATGGRAETVAQTRKKIHFEYDCAVRSSVVIVIQGSEFGDATWQRGRADVSRRYKETAGLHCGCRQAG